jgi:MFS family permease
MGSTSSAAVLAAVIGLLLGGLLTDVLSLCWVFYVNLPLGLVALLLLEWAMPRLDIPGKDAVQVSLMPLRCIQYWGSCIPYFLCRFLLAFWP